jgi:hypothetical protein
MKKLIEIQNELKAPKSKYNSFGKFSYRSCEDILEAVKPLLKVKDLIMTISDEAVNVGDKNYIKATVTITDGDKSMSVSALAREAEDKKGMNDSQITGTASSYARKYALNGMFLIDDTKDADTDEYKEATKKAEPKEETFEDSQISPIKAKTLKALCEEKGTDVKKLCEHYKVKSIDALSMSQYAEAVKTIEKKHG